MSVSSIGSAVHPSTAKPASEAVEGPGPDHDGDKHDSPAPTTAVSGRPAPGGGVYL